MLGMVGRKIRKAYRGRQVPHGKQSVRKLMAHGTATNSIELSGDAKSFDRVARKWNVDYAVYKTGPDKYLLFFKAGQADAMTACFSEYSRKVLQALLQRDTRTSPKGREVHLFSGFLKCADCGRAITRCVGKNNNVYYSCSTYKNRSRTACTMHSIKHERLEAAVLFAVQHQVHLAVSYSEIVTQINSAPIKKSQSYRLDDLIAAKERELTKITRYKQSLYQDWKDGEITQQEYRDMKADYERQTSDISAVLTRLNAERAELANGVDNEHPALVAFMKYQNIEALNREILVELVDYIKVYENGNISVKFKFADELRKIAEYIEINTKEDTAVAG